GINGTGQIVGEFNDGTGMIHGYLLSGGTFTTIDVHCSPSISSGINATGQIVGYFGEVFVFETEDLHGFLASRQSPLSITVNRGRFATTDVPLIVSVRGENLSMPAVVDFFFGARLPDRDTVVFFTDLAFASGAGSWANPATWRPIVTGVDLTTPLTFDRP